MKNAELIKALRRCWKCPCDANCPRYEKALDVSVWTTAKCALKLQKDSADAIEAADKRIAELEAQMPKEGEWIEQDDGDSIFFKCSVCGKIQYNVLLEMMQGEYHYCPYCGAKMKGENDGET